MKQKPDQQLVLTIPQAAERLQMSAQSAYAAAKRGEIPTVRYGGLIRVPARALERMLEGEK
jgi:excisionase family DNA binding protein